MKKCLFVTVILLALYGRAQSGLQENAIQIQSEINRQKFQENLLRERLADPSLSMAEKVQIVSKINQLQFQGIFLRAQLASGGGAKDHVDVNSSNTDGFQHDMDSAIRNIDTQTRQFMDQMNNQPGVQDFLAANACVKTDPIQAFKLYQSSASAGWKPAYYMMARCYYGGIGTELDTKLGAKWLIKAANTDDEEAQMDLARAYKAGNGVEQNAEMAEHWAQRAQQTLAVKQMVMGQIMQSNMSVGQSSMSTTRDQILRSKIEREQRSLQATEDRLDQTARSGAGTSSLSATIEAQKRLIQTYQNQLSQ